MKKMMSSPPRPAAARRTGSRIADVPHEHCQLHSQPRSCPRHRLTRNRKLGETTQAQAQSEEDETGPTLSRPRAWPTFRAARSVR